ncbi:MAG: hypothetical protein AMXMBFR53_00430 [Gemmatimonadota bacterium]
MSTPFHDHFSGHAELYRRHRPSYPGELYTWLAGISAEHGLAWDAATGNGQAAAGLAEHFRQVLATDASRQQLAHAQAHPAVRYALAPSERPPLADARVDLITVAQAVHWQISTWSSVSRYRAAHGSDPLELLRPRLADAWPDGEELRQLSWPLFLRVGRL